MAKKLTPPRPRPIVSRKGVQGGDPCFKGTRIPAHLIGSLGRAHGIAEALKAYPTLTREEVESAIEFVKKHRKRPRPPLKLGRLISSKIIRVKKGDI